MADHLTSKGIEWVRPKSIPWVDGTGKKRRYYPDFYIPAQDLYLDPKNPRVMERDKEKLAAVSQKINLLVGHIDVLIEHF